MVRKLSRFSRIFIKPRKFSPLNFCSSESSDMYKGGDGKNRETFPRIPDEPSKPRNFCRSRYKQGYYTTLTGRYSKQHMETSSFKTISFNS